jgi:prophage antirepressor-like protein
VNFIKLERKVNQIQTFQNEQIGEIRGVEKNGELWFLAGNVCDCLGIVDSRHAVGDIINNYRDIEKDISKGGGSTPTLLKTPKSCLMDIKTAGGKQKALFIDEQCLYELIFNSRKKKARAFRAWITGTVIPSLRQHGSYRMEGKLIRRSMTDAIKESGEPERMAGNAYATYSVLVNRTLGLPDKNDRDKLDAHTLKRIATVERMVDCMLLEGKSYTAIANTLAAIYNT